MITFTNRINDDHQAEDQSIKDLHHFQVEDKLITVLLKSLFNSVNYTFFGGNITAYIYYSRYLMNDKTAFVFDTSVSRTKIKLLNCSSFIINILEKKTFVM